MTENEYSQKAIEVYSEKLKSSTRFEVNNIIVHDSRTYNTLSYLLAGFALETRSETNSFKGTVSSESGDIVSYNDKAQYKNNVSQAFQQERTRNETLDESVAYFQARPYASIASEQRMRTHNSRILYVYTCESCGGHGELICGKCNGNGKHTCEACNGAGQTRCSRCGGSGVMELDSASKIVLKQQYDKCDRCYGKGVVSCNQCGSRGIVTCSNCKGSGKIRCSTCDGTGKLTEATRIHTYVQPSYLARYPEDSLPYLHEIVENKIGLPDFTNYGDIKFDKVDKNYEDRDATFLYNGYLTVCEIDIQINDLRTTVIIFGKNYTLFDSGGVIGHLLNDDLELIEDLSTEKVLLFWPYQKIINQPISQFMESEVNQDMIDELNKNNDYEVVFENLGRSLSMEYIKSAHFSLSTLLVRLSNKLYVEGGVIIFFASALMLLIFFVFGSPDAEPFQLVGISLAGSLYTFFLYILASAGLALEWYIYYRMISKMGQERLRIFAQKVNGKVFVWNMVIVLFLVTVINYTSLKVFDKLVDRTTDIETSFDNKEELEQNQEVEKQLESSDSVQEQVVKSAYLDYIKEKTRLAGQCFQSNECEDWNSYDKKMLGQRFEITEEDKIEEKKIYQRECDNGNSVACNDLGKILEINSDPSAVEYYKKACDMGYPFACYDMERLTN